MAERRMFAKSIVLSDAFLDMPMSARCLYFTLGMFADDDGFIGGPKSIMRQCGASEDDMRILLSKRYVLSFESGVIVIKHWRLNNYLQGDRHRRTTYIEELNQLSTDPKGSYTEKCEVGIPNVYKMYTDCIHSIDKDSIDKDSIGKDNNIISNDILCQTQSVRRVVEEWNTLSVFGISQVAKIDSNSKRYKSLVARLNQYGEEQVLKAIIRYSDFLQGKHDGKPWQITFDWFVLPNNFPKVLENNYKNSETNFSNGSKNYHAVDADEINAIVEAGFNLAANN